MIASPFAWPWQQAAGPRSKRHNDESVQSPRAINQTTESSSTSQPTAKGTDLELPATSGESGTVNPSPSGIPEAVREFIVFLNDAPGEGGVVQRAQALMRSLGVKNQPTLVVFDQLNGFAINITEQQAQRLQALGLQGLGGIRSVEANAAVFLEPPIPGSATPGSTLQPAAIGSNALTSYSNGTAVSGETLPWGVRAVWQGNDVSTRGNFASDTYAFVIDSGVLSTTGDLNLARTSSWHRSWVSGEGAFTDGNGHGSHVAGTIAALANGEGVVGVAPGAQVVSLKVFDSSGGGASYTSIIDAINHAVAVINDNSLDKSKVVINMSLGGGFSSSLDTAVKNAAGQGIRLAVAAGNDGKDADGYSPAAAGDHPNVFTISAVDSQYQMASWSNWDQITSTDSVDDVDFAAPGVSVLSYYQNGQLAYLSGTSMATPHLAGLLLAGGVQAGSLVTPYYSGTADPFALGIQSSTPDPEPEPEPEPSTDQILWGTTGSDIITGGIGNDRISGVLASGTTASALGRSQIDTLTGGGGADLFLIADSRGTFYNDGNSRSQGTGDYALIKDFKTAEGDRLQLRAGTQVLYRNVTINGIVNTEIFLGNGDNRFNAADELIARLQNTALAPWSGVAVVGSQSWTTYV